MTQPLPEQPLVDETEEQRSLRDRLNDRKVLAAIGAAVVVVALLGLFVVKPLLSGSSSNSSDNFVVPHHTVKPKASASASPSATAAATPAPQLKVRDPFSPLVAPVTASAAATASATTEPTTPTIVVVQPSTAPSSQTYTLKLDKVIDTKTVQVTLNGNTSTVTVGQNFPDGTNGPFQLTQVAAGGPAEFTYGDQPFAMAVGETQTES